MKKQLLLFILCVLWLLSTISHATSARLELLYFYDKSCGVCQDLLRNVFPKVEAETGVGLELKLLDIEDEANLGMLLRYEKELNTQGKDFPVLVVGKTYLSGEKEIREKIFDAVRVASLAMSTDSTGSISHPEVHDATHGIQQDSSLSKRDFIGSLSPLPVFFSGLVDGVNPCAFATLIFLLSYLFFVKMERIQILRIGVAYTFGVFICYFLVGFGVLGVLRTLAFHQVVGTIIRWLSVGMVALLLVLSVADVVTFIRTRKTDFLLQLPDQLKKMIHSQIRSSVNPGISMFAAFLLGVAVSFFELACTGQIYLPTILYILKDPSLKWNGIAYLALYNLAFIMPLIAVFVLAWFGLEKKALEHVFRKNILLLKVLIAIVFLLLLIYLL